MLHLSKTTNQGKIGFYQGELIFKCDERKPTCSRCEKSYRKCAFPQSPVFADNNGLDKPSDSKTSKTDPPGVLCHDVDSPNIASDADRISEDVSDQQRVVKFHSNSLQVLSEVSSETLKFEINSKIPVLTPPGDGTNLSPLEPSAWLVSDGIDSLDGFCVPTESPLSTAMFISRFPGQPVPLYSPNYLQFHRERIIAAHYFWHYDYREFCTKTILMMAESSVPLHHAVVAFSALIYSVKYYYTPARDDAFAYYHYALLSLHQLLPTISTSTEKEYVAALATALQLASFDVIPQSISL